MRRTAASTRDGGGALRVLRRVSDPCFFVALDERIGSWGSAGLLEDLFKHGRLSIGADIETPTTRKEDNRCWTLFDWMTKWPS
jgi:hypothetical protein